MRRSLLDDVLKETVLVGVHLDHASQRRCFQSRLRSMRHHADSLFDARNSSGQDDGCNDIRPCKPDRLFAGQIIDSDVLPYAVVERPNGKDLVIRANERKEFASRPQLALKASVERNPRKKLPNFIPRVGERNKIPSAHTNSPKTRLGLSQEGRPGLAGMRRFEHRPSSRQQNGQNTQNIYGSDPHTCFLRVR